MTVNQNLALFCERFPKYALFALHWKPERTALQSLPKVDLSKVEVLYLCDLAGSYSQWKSWLQENSERRLVLIESHTGTIASIFQEETDLFQNVQVDIEFMPIDPKVLANRYPVGRIEVIGNKKIRLQLLEQTTLSYSQYIERMYGYQSFDNFIRNIPYVKQAFYANGFKNAFPGATAIVCGAGPSLQKVTERLSLLDKKALVIAGGSAVAGLSIRGVIPHFGVAIDPNLEEYRRFRNSFAFHCPLLFSTRLCSEVFRTCNGPFGYLRAGIGGVPELWMEEELGLIDPLLGHNVSQDSLSVMPICLGFAEHLGCSRVILVGVDLAYTGGKRYAEGISDEPLNLRQIDTETTAMDRILRRQGKQGKFVQTAVRWVMEAKAIAHFAKKHPEIHWINATEDGLRIDGVEERPFASLEFLDSIDYRKKIQTLIDLHPMPKWKKEIIGQLKTSLERLIGHLEILAEEKKGSKPLAELEMQEELVTSVLFYDMPILLRQSKREDKWALYLEIARKYQFILHWRTRGAYSEEYER